MRNLIAISISLSVLGAAGAQAQEVTVEAQVDAQVGTPGQQLPPPAYQQYPQQTQQPYYGQPQYPQQVQQPYYGQPQYPQQQPYYGQPAYQQPYYQGQPQYIESSRSITGLWLSGVIILPVSYILTWSAATASVNTRNVDWWAWSWVPLVGPWFMIGQPGANGSEIAGGVIGGLAQATGLLLIILGIAIREPVRVQRFAQDRGPSFAFDFSPVQGGGVASLSLTHF